MVDITYKQLAHYLEMYDGIGKITNSLPEIIAKTNPSIKELNSILSAYKSFPKGILNANENVGKKIRKAISNLEKAIKMKEEEFGEEAI